ncbi:MAG: xylulokinase [Candidatus Dormibacteraceae bacterium]
MTVLFGLDVGTTGARAIAVDPSGRVIATANEGYGLSMPRPGWSEQDPADWWNASRIALAKVAWAARGQRAAIGLTGQMHGSVFLDDRGEVIRPALLWNDQRTNAQCEEITRIIGREDLIAITGNPALTGFQAPKILWLRENEPENYARVRHVLLPKDYVRYMLTGQFATDVSDASGTLLLDMRHRDWSPLILDRLEVPSDWLPTVHESPALTAKLMRKTALKLGLPEGTLVAAGASDNAAAAVGIGVIAPGVASSSIGTSGVIFAPTATYSPDAQGRLHAFCHAVPGGYHLMGVTLAAGGSLRWWREQFAPGMNYDDLMLLAASAPAGAEGLIFLPYLFGERTPHLDPLARGAFIGLTGRHGLSHMLRAVMEGVVFSLRQSLEIMRNAGQPTEIRAVGGGAKASLWLRLQADIYGLPLSVMAVEEGAAYGAVLLAAVSAGEFRDVTEASQLVRIREVVDPDRTKYDFYSEMFQTYSGVYLQLRDAMHSLARAADTTTARSGALN